MTQPKLPNTAKDAAARAREQAEAYDSLFANTPLTLDDGSTMDIPPHPDFGMLDDPQMEAYEDLQFETRSYDREPDIIVPERPILDSDGKPTGHVAPAETIRGELIRPFQITVDGVEQRVRPAHSIRVVMAALGDTEYKRLRAGGKSAADVWRIWGKQGLEIRLRRGRSETDGGAVDMAPISIADSE